MNTTRLSFGLLLVSCLLCACHNNPLKTNKEQQSTRFLINASVAAVKQIKPEMDAREARYVYLSCMKGKEASFDCNALYQAMTSFAKNASFVAFKGIRVADLTDHTVFESLREEYEERLYFNNLED